LRAESSRTRGWPVDPVRLDRNEQVLRSAGRDDDKPTHRSVAGVPDGVGHPPGNEDEATGGDGDLAVSELERRVAVRDVERLVGVRVDVQRRRRLSRRERADDDDVGTLRLGRAEGHGLGCVGGRNDGAPADGLHGRRA